MSEKGRNFLMALCKLSIQALAILAGVLVVLWFFAGFIIYGW